MTESEFARRLSELRPLALRIAFSITRNHFDTDDALQEADVKWWNAVRLPNQLGNPSGEPGSDSLYFWLVRCCAIDAVRKRWRRDKLGTAESDLITNDHDGVERSPLDHVKADGPPPDQAAEATERRQRLDRCLEKLRAVVPPDDFSLWWQCDGQERSLPEIAAKAGLNYEASKSRVRRVREKLRRIINADSSLQTGE
jgi:RNA polymerase sigma factor (sigma-70 family)